MTAVIVVCTGNVCRSPIAEGLMRRATEHRSVGAPITVSSAGTAGWEGSPAMPEAVEAVAERGVDISDHVATRLRPGMAAVADLVLCMAAEHRDQIASEEPQAVDRTFTLKELVRLLEGGARTAATPAARPARRGASPWTRTSPTRSGCRSRATARSPPS
jgi:protein-tyrosine-phosphatase